MLLLLLSLVLSIPVIGNVSAVVVVAVGVVVCTCDCACVGCCTGGVKKVGGGERMNMGACWAGDVPKTNVLLSCVSSSSSCFCKALAVFQLWRTKEGN